MMGEPVAQACSDDSTCTNRQGLRGVGIGVLPGTAHRNISIAVSLSHAVAGWRRSVITNYTVVQRYTLQPERIDVAQRVAAHIGISIPGLIAYAHDRSNQQ